MTTAAGLRLDHRLTGLIVASIALTITLVALPNWPVGVFQDDAIYVALGKALASGQGYRYVNLPGAPYATHYPPGYPLVLAMLWRLAPQFPQNVAAFTFANAAFLALAAYGSFRFTRDRLGVGALGAGIVAVAGTATVPALSVGVFVLSEPMFMAALFPTLILAERAADRGEWRDALIAGFAGGALAMVRTMGMFVAFALVLVLLWRRRWPAAAVAAIACAAFLIPWNLWVRVHAGDIPPALVGKYGPYDTWVTTALRAHGVPFVWDVIGRNVRSLRDMVGAMLTGGAAVIPMVRIAAAASAMLVLVAGARSLARPAPVTAWFFAAYMTLVLIWPFDPVRFVWALLPILAAMFALVTIRLARWKPATTLPRLARFASLGTCTLLVTGFAAFNLTGDHTQWRDAGPRATSARATPVVAWVRASTRPGDIIATEDDPLIYLYTGRKAVPVGTLTAEQYLNGQSYAFATDQLHSIIARYRPNYIVGTTSYAVVSARNLSMRTPSELRVHMLFPTAAIFTPVAP